jgi:AmmeMemoRadiSam system protein B
MSIRESVVAGQFYPDNKEEIEAMVEHYNKILSEHITDKKLFSTSARAVIVPHAGYIYSGFTANIALRILANTQAKHVVVIGPSHHVYLEGTSVSNYEQYETPLGYLPIDLTLAQKLMENFNLHFQADAHQEHSTEVQMPFIKTYLKDTRVLELVYGNENPQNLAEIIDFLLEDPETVVVISTDLSHYHSLEKANTLDNICLEAVDKLSPSTLHQGCEACGKIGIEAMLIAAKKRGMQSLILDYRTSADASGDKSQVVGYMSALFTEENR